MFASDIQLELTLSMYIQSPKKIACLNWGLVYPSLCAAFEQSAFGIAAMHASRRALKQCPVHLWLTNVVTHAVLNHSLERMIRTNELQQKRAAECQRGQHHMPVWSEKKSPYQVRH